MTKTEPLVEMPKAVAEAYLALGISIRNFASVFRPENGHCFRSMGEQLCEFANLATSGKLCKHRGLEKFHSICSTGHIALERVISWHRQPPEQHDWLPYLVSLEEAEALTKLVRALRDVDREVQTHRWNGVGGGVRFTQTICALEAVSRPEVDLFAFNTGMGGLVLQFGLLALHRS